jgi:adenosylcobinamide-GDP ribazoletransferase
VQKLIAAFKYLTIWSRFTAFPPANETVGMGAIFFPVVGLALGLLLALMNYLLAPYADSEILSIGFVAALIVATGGAHLDGVTQTFLASAPPSERHAPNALGFAAVVLVILFKAGAANSMDERLTLSLLLMPVLARWALVVFIFGCQDRCDEAARATAARVGAGQVLILTAATLALVYYLLGRKGLLIGFLVSLLALLTRSLLYRRRTPLTHADFGTVIEFGEVLSLILLASL